MVNAAVIARQDEMILEIFAPSFIRQLTLSLPVSVSLCWLIFNIRIGSAVQGIVMTAYVSQMEGADNFEGKGVRCTSQNDAA